MRRTVNKHRSARNFNRNARKTHPVNKVMMRGGFRF